jgi:hypothetical protein
MENTFKIPREIEVARSKELARFENNSDEECPLCSNQYTLSEANGHQVKVCIEHKIVMPCKVN